MPDSASSLTPQDSSAPGVPVDRAVRLFVLAAAWLVGSTAASLLLFPHRTAEYFAWTIQPPLSAAWLGSGYASAFLALWLARSRRDWRDIRIGVAVVATGLIAILAATLLHLDRFHWSSPHAGARLWAWAWLGWYVLLLPALGFTLWRQRRLGAAVAAAQTAMADGVHLPRAWRVAAGLTALLLLGYGAFLFLVPSRAAQTWPWMLTPLTARMVGAWWVGFGVALAFAAASALATRIAVAAPAFVLFALLGSINLLRFGDALSGPGPQWPVLGLLGLIGGLGLAALPRTRATRTGGDSAARRF